MEDKNKDMSLENFTKYGEFISSFDAWLSFEQQKKRANHLESNTKKSKIE